MITIVLVLGMLALALAIWSAAGGNKPPLFVAVVLLAIVVILQALPLR